jgi:hypothetical protein
METWQGDDIKWLRGPYLNDTRMLQIGSYYVCSNCVAAGRVSKEDEAKGIWVETGRACDVHERPQS